MVLTHLEVCAPVGGDVEDLDVGDDGAQSPEHCQVDGTAGLVSISSGLKLLLVPANQWEAGQRRTSRPPPRRSASRSLNIFGYHKIFSALH